MSSGWDCCLTTCLLFAFLIFLCIMRKNWEKKEYEKNIKKKMNDYERIFGIF